MPLDRPNSIFQKILIIIAPKFRAKVVAVSPFYTREIRAASQIFHGDHQDVADRSLTDHKYLMIPLSLPLASFQTEWFEHGSKQKEEKLNCGHVCQKYESVTNQDDLTSISNWVLQLAITSFCIIVAYSSIFSSSNASLLTCLNQSITTYEALPK